MSKDFSPDALDIRAFAQAGARLEGVDPLSAHGRLAEGLPAAESGLEAVPVVRWSATGRLAERVGRPSEVWLDLRVDADVPQICQRCLQPVQVAVQVARAFLFVADERTAGELDEDLEDDVLVISRRFDLHELIEDEILMALPIVPHHEVCPSELTWPAEDEGYAQAEQGARRQPFAALDVLKKRR
ncbi:MAG: DUF177 domain-containing protein [Comamonas sp.]